MSIFVDRIMIGFLQEEFVSDLLVNQLGLVALFNTTFLTKDVAVHSIELGSTSDRSYKVPAFETVRSRGTNDRIVPDVQRVRTERHLPRFGRLEWVDVSFDAVLVTKVETLAGVLESVAVVSLEDKIGSPKSIGELRAKLLDVYAPSIVDDLFVRLRIRDIEDFRRQVHLFVELVGASPPAFDPASPAASRSFEVAVKVKITDGFDMAGALQSAKLCRDILEHEAMPDTATETERVVPYAFVTIFSDAAVTDDTMPGQTAAETKAAVQALFSAERMFAQFLT